MNEERYPRRDTRPGRPVASGLTPLSPEEQAEHDRRWRAIVVNKLGPQLDEWQRCMARARVAAQTAVIG